MRTTYRRTLLIAGLLTALYLLGIGTDLWPGLRGPLEWRWPRIIPGTYARAWLSAALLVAYLVAAHFLQPRDDGRSTTRSLIVLLLAAGLMTPLLQLALLAVNHADFGIGQLFYRTVSELSGGFFNVGAPVNDIRTFLANFAANMPSYPVHPQRHPPGLPVLFALARGFFDGQPELATAVAGYLRPLQCQNLPLMNLPNSAIAAATIQMAVPALLGLMVIPLYVFGRMVYGEGGARRAALLWPLVPSVALWASRWNQLYGLFTLLALIAAHAALARRKPAAFFLSGLVLGISLFFSFGNVVIALFVGLYALVWWLAQAERPPFRTLVWGGTLFLAGAACLWLVALLFGVNFPDIWSEAMSTHLSLGRSYWVWLFYHPYDFLVFCGIVVAAFWAVHTWQAFRGWRQRPQDVLGLSFAIGLAVVVLSGTSQGEVARVWAFLIPPLLLVAVPRATREPAGPVSPRLAFTGMAALLAAQVFVSNLYLSPVSTGLLDPPSPPPAAAATATPLAAWEDGPTLAAADFPATVSAGDVLPVALTWSATQPSTRPYTVFVHLLDGAGNLVAQSDGMPLGGNWPTTCWQPGAAFTDEYEISLPGGLAAGDYQLSAGFYWLPSLERLPLQGTTADSIPLGSVRLSP